MKNKKIYGQAMKKQQITNFKISCSSFIRSCMLNYIEYNYGFMKYLKRQSNNLNGSGK
jgi:hypothetical protein